jgi:hypothetical protein
MDGTVTPGSGRSWLFFPIGGIELSPPPYLKIHEIH